MTLVTGSWFLDAALVLLPLLYWYMTRNFGFWKKLGVPYMKPTPFVGNMGGVVMGREHMGDPVLECYRRAGDASYMGMYAFDKPLLMIKDPALIGRVFSTDFGVFYATNVKLDPKADPLLASSLFGQHGAEWRSLRNLLSPGFTSGKIKLMFQLINEIGQGLVRHIDAAASKGKAVELKEAMTCFTTDVVSSIFLGVEGGALEDSNSPMRIHLRDILRENFIGRIIQTVAFFAPSLLTLFHIRIGSKKTEDYLADNIEKLMEHRKANGIVRNDVIDMLMKARDGQLFDDESATKEQAKNKPKSVDKQYQLTKESIAGQVMSFLSAGFHTSSSALAFALFELSRDQELQERVRKHVRQVLSRHGGDVTYEAVSEMTELTNVVNESLRMYPPLNFLNREAARPYQIPGTDLVIPKDTGVVVSVTGLHYDPRYWKQPHLFIPDRFNQENSKDRPSYTFMPFSDGPRTCIGMRIAYVQMKIALLHILNNFEVHTLPETPIVVRYDPSKFLASPLERVCVSFKKIGAP